MNGNPKLSIVIPLLNEGASIFELHEEIEQVLHNHEMPWYEVIFVDDGSKDNSWECIVKLSEKDVRVKGIRFLKNYGKANGLSAGFQQAVGDVVLTMDADLQDHPQEIPLLYQMIAEQGYDLVSGWKKVRHDPILSKNIPSKLFNFFARTSSGIKINDFNCGLKAYKREVVKSIVLYGDMHRYIPILAKNEGFTNITQKVVEHRKRKYGKSKFGYSRFINGFLDLLTLSFLNKFGKRPMHLFGTIGLFVFLLGFFASATIGVQKLIKLQQGAQVGLVTDNPWFFIAIGTMVIGTQLFLAGFVSELLLRSNYTNQTFYKISDRKNCNISDSCMKY